MVYKEYYILIREGILLLYEKLFSQFSSNLHETVSIILKNTVNLKKNNIFYYCMNQEVYYRNIIFILRRYSLIN